MAKRVYDDKMRLDMPFGEALERFVGVKPSEMHANIARAKKKKPPGGKKTPPVAVSGENVTSLKVRRVRKRNTGL